MSACIIFFFQFYAKVLLQRLKVLFFLGTAMKLESKNSESTAEYIYDTFS